ncbi:MAG: hypothetical protein ACYTFY_12090 [Planctomycetota bacterium]
MAISYAISKDGTGLEFTAEGTVNGCDIIEIHQYAHTSELISSLRYRIIDKSKVIANYVSVEEVESIAKLDEEIARINPNLITAIITPGGCLGMTGELWVDMVDRKKEKVRHFYSRDKALAWVTSKLEEN